MPAVAPDEPYVVDHVVPAFGTVATNPAQLAVADTPALTVTASLVLPFPPVQYMVKVHTPAATVWAGRLVKPHVDVTPPDRISQGVVLVPGAWSIALAIQAGDVPLPCRYSGLPAALTTGARDESH